MSEISSKPGRHAHHNPVKNHTKQTCRERFTHKVIYTWYKSRYGARRVQYRYRAPSRKIIFEGKDTNINDVNTNRKNYTTQAVQSTKVQPKIISILYIYQITKQDPENV